MAAESTKSKSTKGDKAGAVFVVGRARYPDRKPGVWSLIGVYAVEKDAKAACHDKWCAYVKVGVSALLNLTMAKVQGHVCFVIE